MTLRTSIRCGLATTVLGFGIGVLAASPGFAQGNPERNAYFGQTHVHTSWSFDAYVFGNTITGPEEAYKYALGQPIKHPGGYMVQLKRPLDFQAVTDHAEYVGTVRLANDPSSAISKLPIAEKLKVRSKDDIQKIYLFLGASMLKNEPIKELLDPQVAGNVWKQTVAIADKYYQPGKFTTFAAYEWTSTPNNMNLHRNVIFKDTKKVPELPFSSIDSTHPEDLWAWMDAQRRAGNELLAISHNANLSDGIMFPLDVDSKGRPIDAAWAQDRMNNEPLSEITQLKGTSETHPSLSPNDEFASFEILNLSAGRRAARAQDPRQLYSRGLPERPRHAGHPRLQPVQVRGRGRERLARHRRRLRGIELFRRPRAPGRHTAGAPERKEGSRIDYGSAQRVGPRRRLGGGEYARVRSSPPCSARRRSAPAARASRCGCSAAGTSAPTC